MGAQKFPGKACQSWQLSAYAIIAGYTSPEMSATVFLFLLFLFQVYLSELFKLDYLVLNTLGLGLTFSLAMYIVKFLATIRK